jgi:diacylglycerol kinase (ATP)
LRRRVAVIVNPAAGGAAGALLDEAVSGLRAHGLQVDVTATARPGDGVRLGGEAAGQPGTCAVVAVGGDGTVREVGEGMARALQTWPRGGPPAGDSPPLHILAAGTGNSLRRAVRGDAPGDLVADIVDPATPIRVIDAIRVVEGDRASFLGASAGYLRWVLDALRQLDQPAQPAGRERYLAAGLAVAQRLQPYAGRVEVDGEVLADSRLGLVAVGGAVHRSGSVALLPGSRLDDGLLDVCVIEATGPDDFIVVMSRALIGEHLGEPGVSHARGRRVVLEAGDGPLAFETDGDAWPGVEQRLTLDVVPAALPLAVGPLPVREGAGQD